MFVEIKYSINLNEYTAILNTDHIVGIVPGGSLRRVSMIDGSAYIIDAEEYEYLLSCLDVAGLLPDDRPIG